MELETVINYLSNSVHLDGLLAEEVKRSLAADVQEELTHATELANRIKQLGGRIPGSMELEFDQTAMQPPEQPTDAMSVVEGVLQAEEAAIAHYKQLIKTAGGEDPVTADLATRLLADEESHRTLFKGYLAEYRKREMS
jgi:bacterioferritin